MVKRPRHHGSGEMFGGSSGGATPFFGLLLMETYGNPLAAVCWVQIDMSSNCDTPRFESCFFWLGVEGEKSNIPHVYGAGAPCLCEALTWAATLAPGLCLRTYLHRRAVCRCGWQNGSHPGRHECSVQGTGQGPECGPAERGHPEIKAIRTQCPSLL